MPASRLPLVALLLATLAGPALAKGDTVIWRYPYGSTTVVWTRQDLQVRSTGSTQPVLSMRDQFRAEVRKEPDLREAETTYQVLSAVGPIVSLQKSVYVDAGGAHPSVLTAYQALDVRKPRQPVLLTDYFPDQAVLSALLNDALVKEALASLPAAPRPRTSKELLHRLVQADISCEYAFTEDLLEDFVFHHLEGNQVAVRLGLTYGAEACRGNLTQIGILLPVPAALAADFQAAKSRRAGFLAKQAKQVHHGASTDLKYDPAPRS